MLSYQTRLSASYQKVAPAVFAALLAKFRDFASAEDALADAALAATEQWRKEWPADPAAWLYQVAVRRCLDRIKHGHVVRAHLDLEQQRADSNALEIYAVTPEIDAQQRLALFFLCAHPSLSPDTQALMMLRYCAQLPSAVIAKAFLSDPESLTKRLNRARSKLEQSGASFALPSPDQLNERLPAVLTALEVLYDQSYADIAGGREVEALARDAMQLSQVLLRLLPTQPDVYALAAIFCFCESRRPARVDRDGVMVPLDQQDVRLWDRRFIAEGSALLQQAMHGVGVSSWAIRAMIHALHAKRQVAEAPAWLEISQLYQALVKIDDSALGQINYAIALARTAELSHAQQVFSAIDSRMCQWLVAYQLAKAELHELVGEFDSAASHFRLALQLDLGRAERAFVEQRLQRVENR
jgi:RNA polymerase sigma-70 factor, ECF subfamily